MRKQADSTKAERRERKRVAHLRWEGKLAQYRRAELRRPKEA